MCHCILAFSDDRYMRYGTLLGVGCFLVSCWLVRCHPNTILNATSVNRVCIYIINTSIHLW